MNNKKLLLSLLTVGMTLGTAWAIRGQFGHEHGAAWAGSIGSIAILLIANRKDWFAKAFQIIISGAMGWGIAGVMSYGMVVGYGRDTEFVNVWIHWCRIVWTKSIKLQQKPGILATTIGRNGGGCYFILFFHHSTIRMAHDPSKR